MEEGDQVTVGQCRPLSKTVRIISGNIRSLQCVLTTDRDSGPFQCSPCPSTYRQSREGVLSVLIPVTCAPLSSLDRLPRLKDRHGSLVQLT